MLHNVFWERNAEYIDDAVDCAGALSRCGGCLIIFENCIILYHNRKLEMPSGCWVFTSRSCAGLLLLNHDFHFLFALLRYFVVGTQQANSHSAICYSLLCDVVSLWGCEVKERNFHTVHRRRCEHRNSKRIRLRIRRTACTDNSISSSQPEQIWRVKTYLYNK